MMDNLDNSFIASRHQRKEEMKKLGLGDVTASAALVIKMHADNKIREMNITDDAEKQQVILEMRQQYEEAYGHSAMYGYKSQDFEEKQEPPEEVDEDAEYQRGYDACVEDLKRTEERKKSAYSRGWSAAWKDALQCDKTKDYEEDQQKLEALLGDIGENDAIARIKEEMKAFDARLKRLEKYTEE
jgi:hypothetical protein